jgi:hypothetical protein
MVSAPPNRGHAPAGRCHPQRRADSASTCDAVRLITTLVDAPGLAIYFSVVRLMIAHLH